MGSRPLSEKEAVKLTSPDIWLAGSAEAAFDFLVEEIHNAKIVISMFDSYKCYFQLYGEGNDLKPRKFERSDTDRLLFEILCFVIFSIVVRVAPRYITGKFSTEDYVSDSHYVRCFNQSLLDCLDKFFNAQKITAVRELVITRTRPHLKCGPGERLNTAKRIAQYLDAGSIEEELRIFSRSVGCAIDPLSLRITEIIGLSHTGMIFDIISKALKAVF